MFEILEHLLYPHGTAVSFTVIHTICAHKLLKENLNTSECLIENHFFYFSTKTYVVGTQKNRLNETVLLSTQNTCLNLWVRKYKQCYAWKVSLYGFMTHIPLDQLYHNVWDFQKCQCAKIQFIESFRTKPLAIILPSLMPMRKTSSNWHKVISSVCHSEIERIKCRQIEKLDSPYNTCTLNFNQKTKDRIVY